MRVRPLLPVVIAGALGAGCLVQIEHVKDARPHFEAARREAARVQGRRGPAKELNVLVFDPADQKLVKVSLPMWVARKIEKRIDWDDEAPPRDRDRAERAVRRHLSLSEIEKAGLGLLLEVEDDEGEQVLVWLR